MEGGWSILVSTLEDWACISWVLACWQMNRIGMNVMYRHDLSCTQTLVLLRSLILGIQKMRDRHNDGFYFSHAYKKIRRAHTMGILPRKNNQIRWIVKPDCWQRDADQDAVGNVASGGFLQPCYYSHPAIWRSEQRNPNLYIVYYKMYFINHSSIVSISD